MWIFAAFAPFVVSQLYTQPVVYYQTPYLSASNDGQYVYSSQPAAYQSLSYQPGLTQSSYLLQTPYVQPSYQQQQYPLYQLGLSPALGLYQHTLAREISGGYLNEFRDATGSLNRQGIAASIQEPGTLADHASYMSLINDKDNFQEMKSLSIIALMSLIASSMSAPYRSAYGDGMMGYGTYGGYGSMGSLGSLGSPYGMGMGMGYPGMLGMGPYGMGGLGGMSGMSGIGGMGGLGMSGLPGAMGMTGYGSPYSSIYGGSLGSSLGLGSGTSSFFKR
ncbi:unnamed protein product [Nippostrongylus brasiliensis]|uniref:Fibroin heavy chain-like n=1 Tax=Nippostrongylus brasiliensis TaxID=27835 RepID=A0A158R2J1_NIPBR|nr:unnamed protein product [Nippostrongylus brasiliensis]